MDGNSEMFNRVRKYKEELNIPEEDKNWNKKNTLERVKSRLNTVDTENSRYREMISELEDRVVDIPKLNQFFFLIKKNEYSSWVLLDNIKCNNIGTIGIPKREKSFLVAQTVKSSPAVQETWVWSLGWEDPLQKEMAPHSSILESDRLKSIGVIKSWTWLSN